MKGKRIISSLLSMAMIFSLNVGMSFAEEEPVTEEPVVEEQTVEEPDVTEQPVSEEEPEAAEEPAAEEQTVVEEEPENEAEEEAEPHPAQTFTGTTPDGTVKVQVSAGEGALPEGTQMYVYNVSEAQIEAQVDTVITGTRNSIVAVNIIFLDKDGNEIEPLTDVTITLENNVIETFDTASLVHINQANEVNLVDDSQIVSFTEEKVVFTTDVFSIYAIVDSGDAATGEHRTTFEFLDQNGNPFKFVNTAGNEVTNQILKDGEVLQNVGFPEINTGNSEIFYGWYFWDPDTQTFTDPVEFDTPITITQTETRYIKANVGVGYYLTFYTETDGGVILTKKQVPENTTYDISQQSVSSEGDHIFVGWSTESYDGEPSGDTRTPITETTVTVSEDAKFYPIFKQAYRLTFVSSKPGSGAKYISTQYLSEGDVTQQPEDPTWTGWEFDYWSTTPHVYEGEGANTAIINNGASGLYTFGQELNADLTLYAYWKPEEVTYRIVYWKQNITDDKNAADSEKTYSYFMEETGTANVHSVVRIPSDATTKGGTGDFKGFKYNAGKSNQRIVVNASGTNILNVYYDRELITMQFYDHRTNPPYGSYEPDGGYNSEVWTNGSSYVTTFTGLYGQTLAQNGYQWPAKALKYYGSNNIAYQINYLNTFVLPDYVVDSNGLLLRAFVSNYYADQQIEYYLENESGGYTLFATGNAYFLNGIVLTSPFEGYEVAAYRRYRLSSHQKEYEEDWKSPVYSVFLINQYGKHTSIEIRLKRIQYTINYLDSTTSEKILDSKTVKYGTSLSSYEPTETPAIPEGKEFDGNWYPSPLSDTPFDWAGSTMPASDLNVYANWDDICYWVKIDPDGGVINSETGGYTYLWVNKGDYLEEYGSIERNYIPSTSGTYVYQYDEFNEDDPDGTQPETRYADYVSGTGSQTYKYEKGAYQFIGWYDVDPVTKEVTTPHDFSSPVTDNVYIRAVWQRVGGYKIVYDAGDGTDAPYDSSEYTDGSDMNILEAPTPPAGYVFEGWEYDGQIYRPGEIVQVNADLADENKEIKITAKYNENDHVPVETTHINWYSNMYDAAGLPIAGVDSAKEYFKLQEGIPYNEKVVIPSISELNIGNEYDDYTFLGWAKGDENSGNTKFSENDLFLKYENEKYYAKDDSGNWIEVTTVGADQSQPCENLYAVWQTEFYVYHSGVAGGNVETIAINKTNLPKGTYNLAQNLTPNTMYGGYYLNQTITEAYNGHNYEWKNPETEQNGTELVPKPKEKYYIKEVPDTYLRPYYQYTYSKSTLWINKLYMMSAIDDLNYKQVGFEIYWRDIDAKVYTSYTIKTSGADKSWTFTPANMFGGDLTGYVMAADATETLSMPVIVMKPYWITPDGAWVFGAVKRTIDNSNRTITNFHKTDDYIGSDVV